MRQYEYFTKTALKLKIFKLAEIISDTIVAYKSRVNNAGKKVYERILVPEEYFKVLFFQQEPSVLQKLEKDYQYWNDLAEATFNNYPEKLRKKINRKYGTVKNSGLFFTYRENAYRLACLLSVFNPAQFPDSLVVALQQKREHYLRKENFKDKLENKKEAGAIVKDTLLLESNVASLADIDINKEPAIKKLGGRTAPDSCSEMLVFNGNTALYRIHCEWQQIVYMLKLINPRQLETAILLSGMR